MQALGMSILVLHDTSLTVLRPLNQHAPQLSRVIQTLFTGPKSCKEFLSCHQYAAENQIGLHRRVIRDRQTGRAGLRLWTLPSEMFLRRPRGGSLHTPAHRPPRTPGSALPGHRSMVYRVACPRRRWSWPSAPSLALRGDL